MIHITYDELIVFLGGAFTVGVSMGMYMGYHFFTKRLQQRRPQKVKSDAYY